MSTPEPSSAFAERLGMVIGCVLAANMTFTTVAPYLIQISPTAVRLIDQQQTILQSIFMVLVGYLWGNSAGNKSKDSAIHAQADAAKAIAQATTPPTPSIPVAPGDTVTVRGEES